LKSTPKFDTGERDAQLPDLRSLCSLGVDDVDAACPPDAVELAVLHAVVDADERVAGRQTADVPTIVADSAERALKIASFPSAVRPATFDETLPERW
jgi:hypothetical protein